jgi:outer membrane protein assembly factor BamD (BamD/ComL family)
LFIACPTKTTVQTTKQLDITKPDGLYQEGQNYLKQKNYDFALRDFTTLVEDFSEDTLADDAQFMIAEILSNPKNPNVDLEFAVDEYQNLIDNYPDSKYIDKANKKIELLEKKLDELK